MFKKVKDFWKNKKECEGSLFQWIDIHKEKLLYLIGILVLSVFLSFFIYPKFIPSEDARFWILSTFVQAFATMIALIGMLTIYKLQTIENNLIHLGGSQDYITQQQSLRNNIKNSTIIFFGNSLLLIGLGLLLLLFIKQDILKNPIGSFSFIIKEIPINNDWINIGIYTILGWFSFSLILLYRNMELMLSEEVRK